MDDERLTFNDIARELISPRMLAIAGGLVGAFLLYQTLRPAPLYPAGPFAEPVQKPIDETTDVVLAAPEGYYIVPTDTYEIEALVLSRARYRWDREADLSPVDFLLGWGTATLEPTVSNVSWSQSGRWGFWQWDGSVPIDQNALENSVANVHIIPDVSNRNVRTALLGIGRGDSVRLGGYLVQVTGENGYYWNSSRSRHDRGDGSCEVFYVTWVEKL